MSIQSRGALRGRVWGHLLGAGDYAKIVATGLAGLSEILATTYSFPFFKQHSS